MNFLQYKSDEMYSSTQLIRQSKMIFDKLSKEEIEKAVILRDGKPSFLLLDFATYEKIMEEYIQLKQMSGTKIASEEKSEVTTKIEEPLTVTEEKAVEENDFNELPDEEPEIEMQVTLEDNYEEDEVLETTSGSSKLSPREQAELDKALLELERVDKEAADKKREELKEFWD